MGVSSTTTCWPWQSDYSVRENSGLKCSKTPISEEKHVQESDRHSQSTQLKHVARGYEVKNAIVRKCLGEADDGKQVVIVCNLRFRRRFTVVCYVRKERDMAKVGSRQAR